MPFEQKNSPETRAAATAKALELRRADPKDRTIIRVVSEEFNVGPQSLRGWINAATPDEEKPAKRARRPKFSPVVTTQNPNATNDSPATSAAAPVEATPTAPSVEERAADADVLALEAEVAALRRGNDALKDAMRVLLGL